MTSHRDIVTMAILTMVVSSFQAGGAATRLTPENIKNIHYEQKLNQQISLTLPFTNDRGQSVVLGDCFNKKPVILVMGYYECPMLCGLVLNGLLEGVKEMQPSVGKEFSVIFVSISPEEKPALAAAKKANCISAYQRTNTAGGWHFLTGDKTVIQKLSDEVGFQFAYDAATKQFAHPSGIVIITPKGKVARYFFGISYSAPQLSLALKDASSNRIGAKVQEFLFLCFHYNPAESSNGKLIMLCIRICGMAVFAGLLGVVWWSWRASRSIEAKTTVKY